ncbi:MAG: hypothetical protein B6I20_01400 [Bacteroidetes bacterium 4572_117]|nr:MAG: hypothetical protein B6I20_01400 [Bacteroidetes bacterium 4572_117]
MCISQPIFFININILTMKKFYSIALLSFFILTFYPGIIFGQRTCASHEHMLGQIKSNTNMQQEMDKLENYTKSFVQTYGHLKATESRTIPVYVHVIYRLSQENISDAQIESQIAVLNLDYGGTNSDIASVPSEFVSVTANNPGIQFVLAGITRKYVNRSTWGTNDAMKDPNQNGVAPVTPETHLNMWICNIGGGILGYAQFPGGNSATDGVVFSPQYCGSSDYDDGSFYLSAPFDKGRTATHEIGHYLNLRHIWGDGPCSATDYVDDTPSAASANYNCPSHPHNTCGSDDMFMNYMDYVDDDCMVMFSLGQEARMWACLNSIRQNLGTTGGNASPVANANGPYSAEPNVAINFSSTGSSDSDGTIDSYSWNFGDGSTSTLANPTHTYTADNVYTVSLTVTDNEGATGTNSTTATISSGSTNQPPVVNVNGPYTGQAGVAVNFSFAGTSDPDGSLASGFWDFGDGTTSTNPNPSHVYGTAGTYTVALSVTDNEGATTVGETTATITGGSSNQPPVVNANGPYSGDVGETINFSFAGTSDPDGSLASGFWDFGDGTTSTSPNPTHAYSTAGAYTVILSVTDNDGATTTDETTATIGGSGNIAPVANANGPYSADEGVSISFSSAGSNDSDGTIASYLWNFGDGNTSTDTNPTHAYTSGGTYSVSLTVTDNEGATGIDQVTATISGSSGTVTLSQSYFESGWDGWTNGGADVSRYSGPFSYEGSYSIAIRDNSGAASTMLSSFYNVSAYNELNISFYYNANGMETGESFVVGYNTGTSWVAIGTFVCGTNFNNNEFKLGNASVSSDEQNFPTNARFAIQCNGSDDSDVVYIDQVIITASSGSAKSSGTNSNTKLSFEVGKDIKIYPNPVSDMINLYYAVDENAIAKIYTMNGTLIKTVNLTESHTEISVSELKSGMYVIKVSENNEVMLKRFIKE